MQIPSLEEIQKSLEGLMIGKQPHEGAKNIIMLTLYTQRQVDAVVNLVGGWESFANLIGDRYISLSITHDGLDRSLVDYVNKQLSLVKDNVNVAQFNPVKEKVSI